MAHRLVPLALIAALALIPAFVFLDIATRFAAEGVASGRAEDNAAMFPRLIAALLAVLLVIQGFREWTGRAAETPSLDLPRPRVWGLFALFLVYLVAFRWLGFVVSTPVFLVLAMGLLGYRNLLVAVIFSSAVTFAIWLVFLKMLNLVLPAGEIFG